MLASSSLTLVPYAVRVSTSISCKLQKKKIEREKKTYLRLETRPKTRLETLVTLSSVVAVMSLTRSGGGGEKRKPGTRDTHLEPLLVVVVATVVVVAVDVV